MHSNSVFIVYFANTTLHTLYISLEDDVKGDYDVLKEALNLTLEQSGRELQNFILY
jgi:hypothetical protein